MAGKHRQLAVSDVIAQAYDAALDPKLWPQVAPSIAAALRSSSTALVMQNRTEVPHWLSRTSNLTDEAVRTHEAYYHKRDVWALRAAQVEMSRIFIGQELISDADFLRTEFCQDFCRKVDACQVIGTVFSIGDGVIGVLGVHRPGRASAYTNDDKVLLGRVFPHLKRALQVRQRLAAAGIQRQAELDALSRTNIATLVVEANGRLLYATAEAERLLREGAILRTLGGTLTTGAPRDAERLAGLIRSAASAAAEHEGGGSGGALTLARDGRLPLTILVAPFRPAKEGFGSPLPAALVFIRDPERPTATTAALQGLFGLTVTEARIAIDLSKGKSMADITREHRISINTAKTHLKAILVKTGTGRQGELVALVLRSVAVLDCE